jgi:hypothetical protein
MAATIIIRFIKGRTLSEIVTAEKGITNFSAARGLSELAKVAIIVTKPACPKTIRTVAIRRLRRSLVINSDSFVVKPVAVKHDSAWNFANDHSIPVN